MPFLIINQSQQKLKEYLNRRKSETTENQNQQTNDFFTRSKYDSHKKLRKSKRFNTTLGQRCDVDFRLQTFYQPSNQYTFTGENFKTKYSQQECSKFITKQNQFDNNKSGLKQNDYQKYFQEFQNLPNSENFIILNSDCFVNKEFDLTKSFLITSLQQKSFKQRSKTINSQFKFRISHPTPVKQAQFLVKLKKDFVKRHGPNKKQKKSSKNNLIKIEEYVSQRKQSFKRHMETQLICSGEAKLLSQIQEKKGKIYLSGLHNAGKKKKQVENIDELLRRSRGSFSTPNTLIAHIKLASEKKNKLENIRKLKEKTMDNCLQKIKSLNIKSQMISGSIKVK